MNAETENKKSLYVIGNGFDLNLGLQTTYNSYFEENSVNKLKKLIEMKKKFKNDKIYIRNFEFEFTEKGIQNLDYFLKKFDNYIVGYTTEEKGNYIKKFETFLYSKLKNITKKEIESDLKIYGENDELCRAKKFLEEILKSNDKIKVKDLINYKEIIPKKYLDSMEIDIKKKITNLKEEPEYLIQKDIAESEISNKNLFTSYLLLIESDEWQMIEKKIAEYVDFFLKLLNNNFNEIIEIVKYYADDLENELIEIFKNPNNDILKKLLIKILKDKYHDLKYNLELNKYEKYEKLSTYKRSYREAYERLLYIISEDLKNNLNNVDSKIRYVLNKIYFINFILEIKTKHGFLKELTDINELELEYTFNNTTTLSIKNEFIDFEKSFKRYAEKNNNTIINLFNLENCSREWKYENQISKLNEHTKKYEMILSKEIKHFKNENIEILKKEIEKEIENIFKSKDVLIINYNYTTYLRTYFKYDMININGSIDDNNIIFGVDEIQIKGNKKLEGFTKTKRREVSKIEWEERIKKEKSKFDKICFYGHSLEEADYSSLKKILDIFDIENSNIELIFIYEKDYYELKKVIGLFERYNKELLIKLIDENRLKVEIHDGKLSYNEKKEDLKTKIESVQNQNIF